MRLLVLCCAWGLLSVGCTKGTTLKSDESSKPAPSAAKSIHEKVGEPKPQPPAQVPVKAAVGARAPAFTLTSYEGKKVSLADYQGKVVVLEWYNPECPFVQYAYDEGPMKSLIADSVKQGVVWLGINSGAPGNQGHGAQTNLESKKAWGLSHDILIDEDGRVGRLYQAAKTPHMYVIGKDGKLVFQGALDTSRGATPEPGDAYTNYTKRAIAAALKGEAVPEPHEPRAWGCSVKYAR